jgi:hypothetical protein
MNVIKIPVGMDDSQIPAYVKMQIRNSEIPRIPDQDPPIPKPANGKIRVIPGDDWVTNSKGMTGAQLKKVIGMTKEYEMRRTKIPKKIRKELSPDTKKWIENVVIDHASLFCGKCGSELEIQHCSPSNQIFYANCPECRSGRNLSFTRK